MRWVSVSFMRVLRRRTAAGDFIHLSQVRALLSEAATVIPLAEEEEDVAVGAIAVAVIEEEDRLPLGFAPCDFGR